MSNFIFGGTILADNSLVVTPQGAVSISVVITQDENKSKVGIIAFGGLNRAVVTFDDNGTQPIRYTMYQPNPPAYLENSVLNIIRHLSSVLSSQ